MVIVWTSKEPPQFHCNLSVIKFSNKSYLILSNLDLLEADHDPWDPKPMLEAKDMYQACVNKGELLYNLC